MISVLFNNKENMQVAQKVNVGADAQLPTYMHRAQLYRNNSLNEIKMGIKLWDIPIGMKHNELKCELENI